MTDKALVIKQNLTAAKQHTELSRIIKEAQILELSCLLANSTEKITPKSLKEIYSSIFGEEDIYKDLLRLARLTEYASSTEYEIHSHEEACIAYMGTPVSVDALKLMTEDIITVKVSVESDFRAACEAVISERADFCILPYCSSVDGYYPTFFKLAKTNDLKICRMVKVQKAGSDEEILFAMLSKKLSIFNGSAKVLFSFTDTSDETLPKLLSALKEENIVVRGVHSSPLEYNMDRLEYTVEASLGEYPLKAFFAWLEATLPAHTVLGTC